jgi:ferritin-like metal-binding protein YciE
MAKPRTLRDLFIETLRDVHHAEGQLVKALPKMAKTASNADLAGAFESHLEETKGHVERLDRVFDAIGEKARGKKCKAMEGLIEEGKEWIDEHAEPDVMDAGLIAAAQKVEHYEIATYGCLCTWAKQLDLDDAVSLLGQNLDEEKAADEKLTGLAESHINAQADSGR